MSSEQPKKVVAVIPARLDSKRLPRKVLQTVAGKPMIQWVYERTQQARRVSRVFVATDSPEVEAACREFTSDVWMSKKPHSCGTDRVAEVVRSIEADIVVNVQSDEPMMEPELIDRLVELFDDPEVQMATAATPIKTLGELLDEFRRNLRRRGGDDDLVEGAVLRPALVAVADPDLHVVVAE